MVVWNALPAEEREALGGVPVSFLDDKVKVTEALERANWPVTERDVALLENEINLGFSYIKQVSGVLLTPAENKRELVAAHNTISATKCQKRFEFPFPR